MATLVSLPSPAMVATPKLKRKFKPDLIEMATISRRHGDRIVEYLSPTDARSLAAISAQWCHSRSQGHQNSTSSSGAQPITGPSAKRVRRFIPELIETTKRSRRVETPPNTGAGTGAHVTLRSLPTELHMEIFSYLDKIDATCLGVCSRDSYCIYRKMHPEKVPLNQRRVGPNSLESAWTRCVQCSHCGVYRCELHAHLADWMPADMEYCAVKGIFGAKAAEGAKESCYRAIPSKPGRCGRHPVRV